MGQTRQIECSVRQFVGRLRQFKGRARQFVGRPTQFRRARHLWVGRDLWVWRGSLEVG